MSGPGWQRTWHSKESSITDAGLLAPDLNIPKVQLEALGLGEALRERGQSYSCGWVRNDRDEVLQHLDLRPLERFGRALALHRADLHAVLGQGIETRYGAELMGLRLDNFVQAEIGGHTHCYDLVVAADGLHSKMRQLLAPQITPVYSGYTSWRSVLPDPLGLTEPTEYWGRGRRIGLVPIGRGKLYVFATVNSPPLVRQATFPRELFQGFPAPVREVLQSLLTGTNIIQTDIGELKTHIWRRPRVAFLGDAAHGMTPNLGQGAGMSIEDAFVLDECLHRHGVTGKALSIYEQVRQGRVKAVAQQSRKLGRLGQLEAPSLIRGRDWLFRHAPAAATRRQVWQLVIRDAPQPPKD